MLPSKMVLIVALTEIMPGDKGGPIELFRAALSCFMTASTNGYDLCDFFSVNHSFITGMMCLSSGMIAQPHSKMCVINFVDR